MQDIHMLSVFFSNEYFGVLKKPSGYGRGLLEFAPKNLADYDQSRIRGVVVTWFLREGEVYGAVGLYLKIPQAN